LPDVCPWKFIIHIWTPYFKSNEGEFLYISVLIILTVKIYLIFIESKSLWLLIVKLLRICRYFSDPNEVLILQ
jgi:hypothetical protein